MRKVVMVISIVALIVAIVALTKSETAVKFDQDMVGEVHSVVWDKVNIREGAGTDKPIITTIHKGAEVTFTGYSQTPCLEGPNNRYWVSVELEDGSTGWMRYTALD